MDDQQSIWKDEISKRGRLLGRPFLIALHYMYRISMYVLFHRRQAGFPFYLDTNSEKCRSLTQLGRGPVVKRAVTTIREF